MACFLQSEVDYKYSCSSHNFQTKKAKTLTVIPSFRYWKRVNSVSKFGHNWRRKLFSAIPFCTKIKTISLEPCKHGPLSANISRIVSKPCFVLTKWIWIRQTIYENKRPFVFLLSVKHFVYFEHTYHFWKKINKNNSFKCCMVIFSLEITTYVFLKHTKGVLG